MCIELDPNSNPQDLPNISGCGSDLKLLEKPDLVGLDYKCFMHLTCCYSCNCILDSGWIGLRKLGIFWIRTGSDLIFLVSIGARFRKVQIRKPLLTAVSAPQENETNNQRSMESHFLDSSAALLFLFKDSCSDSEKFENFNSDSCNKIWSLI